MAVRNKEELTALVNNIVGENADDNVLALLEDIADTYADFEAKLGDGTDWKTKYEENDNEWRKKYKERFMGGGSNEYEDVVKNEPDVIDESEEPKTFEDLFEVEK